MTSARQRGSNANIDKRSFYHETERDKAEHADRRRTESADRGARANDDTGAEEDVDLAVGGDRRGVKRKRFVDVNKTSIT